MENKPQDFVATLQKILPTKNYKGLVVELRPDGKMIWRDIVWDSPEQLDEHIRLLGLAGRTVGGKII